MTRTTILRPLGLVTQPGKHGLPPGALSKALNVCMRDPGIITSMPDVRSYRTDVLSSGYTLRKLFPGDTYTLGIGDSSGTWDRRWISTGASSAITAPFTMAFDTGIANVARTRGRILLTPNRGPVIFDAEGSTTPRAAGMYMPIAFSVDSVTTTNAQSLDTGYVRRYRALFRREHSDGYMQIGPVSNACDVDNTSGSTIDATMFSRLPSDLQLAAGDIFELYRTDDVTTGSDPGDTYRLANACKLTSTDISNTYVLVRDTSTADTLGAELYTNPGQEGLTNTNLAPPLADDVAVFKGYTFYASRKLPASLSFKVNNKLGALSTTAERIYGIGTRTATGDITTSSTTLNNLSNTNGVVIGQIIAGTGIPASTRITNVSGTTITLSAAATATTVGVAVTITDVLETTGSAAYITVTDHNAFLNGQVSESYEIVADAAISTTITAGPTIGYTEQQGAQYILKHRRYNNTVSTPFAIRATNGQNYSPTLPSTSGTALTGSTDTRANRYHWSKLEQPEHVPTLNYGFAGNGTIYRMVSTTDALYFFCSDGLYKLTGDAGIWRVDPIDSTLILAARGAVDQMQGVVWAYTNRGLVAIAGDSVAEVTTGVIGDSLPGAVYADTWDTFLACDELHREVWLGLRSGAASTQYVFNTHTKAFTSVVDDEWSALAYSRALRSLVVGAVSSNPDVLYFEADTSATRMPGADIRFQPITGDGDPFTLKEFVEVDYLFEGIASAGTLVPSFTGTNYTARTLPASSDESHCRIDVPRNAPGVARKVAPGFTLSAGGTAQLWSFRGMSVKWWPAAEEAGR